MSTSPRAHGPGERSRRHRASRRCRASTRTSGSNAAGGTPAASASRATCPSSATRWLDATVAAAWYATRCGVVDPERAHAERHREPLDVGRAVDRAPRARRAGPRRPRATGSDCSGCSEPTLDVGTLDRAACASSSSVHTPERCTTSAPARRLGASGGRGVGDRGVGRGDEHEVGVAARPRRRSRAGASSSAGGAAHRLGASGARPATATRRPPAGGAARARAWSRRGRAPRGRTPAACDRAHRPLRSSPCWGCRTTRATTTLPVRPHVCPVGRDPTPPTRGSRSASGTSTNARSVIRGCGTTRSGSSTTSSPTSSTSTSSVRGPHRSLADPVAPSASRRCASREQRRRGSSVGVDGHDRVEVVGLGRAADRRGLVHRRHRDHRRRRASRASPSTAPGGARAGRRGSSRARGTRAARRRRSGARRSPLDATRRRGRPSRARAGAACAR